MGCSHYRLDPAAQIEVTDHPDPLGLDPLDQIVQDAIYSALVEYPVVPEAPQIKLETLELNARFAREIGDAHRREIGRTTFEGRQVTRITLNAAKRT